MWIDSVTLAVGRLDALDGLCDGLGLARRTVALDRAGAGHTWISLGTTCLELICVSDQAQLRCFTWGRALGVNFWPPIDEIWERCEQGPSVVRISQVDALFPWVISYPSLRAPTSMNPFTQKPSAEVPSFRAGRKRVYSRTICVIELFVRYSFYEPDVVDQTPTEF
ncbi:MAG: hypothetical protein C7B45_11790 [Sulfobacillus acidophilus]|uniref:Uncharacterized protein n=1 Tax=Sulfobacillus acidophilus TaxID=53633 RepID=A0A2T2WG42_9FIRM|nr:MAG: hypothetical protein C7B45_11790 [Sulfobacillus acidophilus]